MFLTGTRLPAVLLGSGFPVQWWPILLKTMFLPYRRQCSYPYTSKYPSITEWKCKTRDIMLTFDCIIEECFLSVEHLMNFI